MHMPLQYLEAEHFNTLAAGAKAQIKPSTGEEGQVSRLKATYDSVCMMLTLKEIKISHHRELTFSHWRRDCVQRNQTLLALTELYTHFISQFMQLHQTN